MAPFTQPPGYTRIKVVSSFEALLAVPFADGLNAICWPRTLTGDFGEVAARLGTGAGITTIEEARLAALPVSAAGKAAVATLLADQRLLREIGHAPVLDCIHGGLRDEDAGCVPTDVHSFHVDSATVPTDTFLCCYTGLASEGLRNDEALRRVDVPGLRRQLLEGFGGADGDAFLAWLTANFHDLHYAPVAQARPFSFGVGNLWRIAVEHPGSRVPACIHRAPAHQPGQPPRLLLIS